MVLRFLTAILCASACSAAVLAFRDVTVIEADRAPQPHLTVIIQGERITAVGPVRTTSIPKDARLIEGRGKFLIPGLWDMHVHLWHPQNQLPMYVAHGVTGVRDMGSDFRRVSSWRKDVLAAKAIGPHIVTSGPPVTGKPSDDDKLPSILATTPDEGRRAVDRLEDMGVDFIKILSNVPRDAYIALAERARHEEIDFAGHVPSSVTAWEVVDARQNSIEHMFGLVRIFADDPDKALETFNEAKAIDFFERSKTFATWQVPTLTLWQRMAYLDAAARMKDPRLARVPAAIRATWPKPEAELKDAAGEGVPVLRSQVELLTRLVRLMQDCGVGILAGTDTGDPYTIPGVTLQQELELLVKAGLTPAQALNTATFLPAKYLRWDESVGRIRPGFVADLVLLDADPLADIRNISKVAGVAARGRYLTRASIARIIATGQ